MACGYLRSRWGARLRSHADQHEHLYRDGRDRLYKGATGRGTAKIVFTGTLPRPASQQMQHVGQPVPVMAKGIPFDVEIGLPGKAGDSGSAANPARSRYRGI